MRALTFLELPAQGTVLVVADGATRGMERDALAEEEARETSRSREDRLLYSLDA